LKTSCIWNKSGGKNVSTGHFRSTKISRNAKNIKT
jgi:hypothetical protein